jgi:hypothetical protein
MASDILQCHQVYPYKGFRCATGRSCTFSGPVRTTTKPAMRPSPSEAVHIRPLRSMIYPLWNDRRWHVLAEFSCNWASHVSRQRGPVISPRYGAGGFGGAADLRAYLHRVSAVCEHLPAHVYNEASLRGRMVSNGFSTGGVECSSRGDKIINVSYRPGGLSVRVSTLCEVNDPRLRISVYYSLDNDIFQYCMLYPSGA